MSTSQANDPQPTRSAREPLRINLTDRSEAGSLDGGWWPQSRDLAVELEDLVDHLPGGARVSRVIFSRPDWDLQPRSVHVGWGRMKVGSFPSDDTHLVTLAMSDHTRLHLLVVPADHQDGAALMGRGFANRDYRSATAMLQESAAGAAEPSPA